MSWTKQSIHALLDQNPKAVYKALQAIYARQTADEQACQYTRHDNGVGFSKFDAELLSDIARRSRRFGSLTDGQVRLVRPRIKRYWRQLVEIANERDARQPKGLVVEPVAQAAQPSDQEVYEAIDRAELAAAGVPVDPRFDGLMVPVGDCV